MPADVAEQRCRRHRRRQAAGICVSCHSPGCPECLATTRVGVKCRRCPGTRTPGGWGVGRRIGALLAGLATAGGVTLLIVVFAVRGSGSGAETPAPVHAAPAASTPLPDNPYGTPIPCDVQHSMC